MITLYIWARDEKEAVHDIREGYGDSLDRTRCQQHRESEKLYKVTINAKEVE
jgi:hypothetical protein